MFTDANVRTHEVLSPNPNAPGRRRKVLAAVGAIGMVVLLPPQWSSAKKFACEFYAGLPGVLAFESTRTRYDSWTRVARKSPPLSELRLDPAGILSKYERKATRVPIRR